jgi:hypothetical protein
MISLSIKQLTQNALYASVATATVVSMLFLGFFMAEPNIGFGQVDTTPAFRIRQTITDETSFYVDPANVTMQSSIAGLTGGNATGTASFVVRSNNATGYYVNIAFTDNVGNYAMRGDTTGSQAIRDYTSTGYTSSTTYNWIASSSAQFGYNVTSSTTLDTSQNFLNNGTRCGAGSSQTAYKCWRTPTVASYEIVNRDSAALTGASSTITFKVNVPSGATPAVSAGTYTATATLSLFLQ